MRLLLCTKSDARPLLYCFFKTRSSELTLDYPLQQIVKSAFSGGDLENAPTGTVLVGAFVIFFIGLHQGEPSPLVHGSFVFRRRANKRIGQEERTIGFSCRSLFFALLDPIVSFQTDSALPGLLQRTHPAPLISPLSFFLLS